MDIQIYEDIYNSLEKFLATNESSIYGASLVHYPSSKPTYPYVIFEEIRNQPVGNAFGEIPDRLANLGYAIKIYAKTKGSVSKMTIARNVAVVINEFLTQYVGIKQVSLNPDPNVADGELYGLIIMYNTNYYENKQQIRR